MESPYVGLLLLVSLVPRPPRKIRFFERAGERTISPLDGIGLGYG